MPIRTNRGRAVVYRTVWGWPLRSPKHLVAAALVLAGVGVGVAFALAANDSGQPTTATPSSTSRPNMFDPASRAAVPEPEAARPGQAPDAALEVADSWVRAFLNTSEGVSSQRWAEQMRPYTTAEAYPVLELIDPANIPDAEVIGDPRTVSTGSSKAEVDVPTSVTVVRLLLVSTPDGWRVAGFEQVG